MNSFVLALACVLARAQEDGARLELYDIRDLITGGREEAETSVLDRNSQIFERFLEAFSKGELRKGIKCRNGQLVVRAPLADQEWVKDLLRRQRQGGQDTIEVAVRCLKLPQGAFARMGLEEGVTTALRVPELEAWIARARAEGAEVLTAPRLATWPLQPAMISVLNQISYVKAYEVYERVEPTGARIVDPVVETLNEGLMIELCAGLFEEDAIGLQLQVVRTEVERPIAKLQTQYGEIAVPNVQTLRVDTHLKLGPDAAAVFSVAGHKDERLAVVVTARRAPPPK